MRMLVTLVIILTIIIGSAFWTNHSLQTSADELAKQIILVNDEVKSGKWESALAQMGKLETTWQNKAKWWPVFLDHQEMDNIEFSLAKAKAYVANQDQALALGQLSELKLMVKHIPLNEKVSIENIL